MKFAFYLLIAVTASGAFAEKYPLDRYQSIIDRHPFGEPPPGFDPDKLPSEVTKTSAKEQKEITQEQQKLQSSVHFSVINVTPGGETVVGFTDNADPKAPRHYYLKVGEEREGWKVLEADAAKAWMKIAKDEIEVELEIGGNSGKGGGSTSSRGGVANAASAPRAGLLGGGVRGNGLLSRSGSLRDRRLRRREEQARSDAEVQAARERAEQERKEREAREEEERLAREQERAEQKDALMAMQEQIKQMRAEKEKAAKAGAASEEDSE